MFNQMFLKHVRVKKQQMTVAAKFTLESAADSIFGHRHDAEHEKVSGFGPFARVQELGLD